MQKKLSYSCCSATQLRKRAEIIAQMNVAGGLSAAEDSFHVALRANQEKPFGNRHNHAEDYSEHSGEHGQNQQEKAKPLKRFESLIQSSAARCSEEPCCRPAAEWESD